MLFIISTLVLLAVIYLNLRKVYSKLSSQQINHLPIIPVIGNVKDTLLKRQHSLVTFEKAYNTFPDDRIIGFYEFMSPVYIAKDLELVKRITVKDFEHFVDRVGFSDKFQDPLFAKSLLLLKGEEWKAMRGTLSPAFTSSKIRLMVPFMVEVGSIMTKYLTNKIKEAKEDYKDMDVKNVIARYAYDVIATCAFGLKVNSVDQDNEFYVKSREATKFNIRDFYKVFILRKLPKIAGMLKLQLISNRYSDFFRNLVFNTIKQREEQNVIRNDMIHLLMQAKKGNLSYEHKEANDDYAGFAAVKESTSDRKTTNFEWTDDHLVAQCFLFLLAGFETISTVISFIVHELALQPDIQDKLYQEIRKHYDDNNGLLDYASIQKMTYLDMVVSETLRKWPPTPIVNRLCIKDYNLGKANDKANHTITLQKGEGIRIPIWPIHRDPNFFPDPEKFDPERFSDVNIAKIKPFSYIPFGLGPRSCIGSRFALCNAKVIVCQLLLNLELMPCEKTCVSNKLDTGSLQLCLSGGHWLRIKMRSNN